MGGGGGVAATHEISLFSVFSFTFDLFVLFQYRNRIQWALNILTLQKQLSETLSLSLTLPVHVIVIPWLVRLYEEIIHEV